MIGIGGQYGGAKSGMDFIPLQKQLNKLFEKYVSDKYFKTVVKLGIAFRVSGSVTDFKSEGPERLEYLKKHKTITIDLVFKESDWRGVDKLEIKKKVESGVRASLELLIARAEKEKELLDKEKLVSDIEKAMTEFHNTDLGKRC